MSLLAELVVWKSFALSFPNSTVSSVIESWRLNYIKHVPAEAFLGALVVPVFAAPVAICPWTDGTVFSAEFWVIDRYWRGIDYPIPTKASVGTSFLSFLAYLVVSTCLALTLPGSTVSWVVERSWG